MTWIKICGITNLEDAQIAVEAGADALGFVFYEKSPRKVSPTAVRDIVAESPVSIDKVGVFVDAPAEEMIDIVRRARLSSVQIHALQGLNLDDIVRLKEGCAGSKVIYARPGKDLVDGGFFISEQARNLLYALMFDSSSADRPGGTGKRFDWENARPLVQAVSLTVPVIVAGGLNPDNIKEAIRLFQPYGVDVSSGVEAKPGKKDPGKVRAFIQAVREADKAA
jgi:phosphoribosylanthranilate isomerase